MPMYDGRGYAMCSHPEQCERWWCHYRRLILYMALPALFVFGLLAWITPAQGNGHKSVVCYPDGRALIGTTIEADSPRCDWARREDRSGSD